MSKIKEDKDSTVAQLTKKFGNVISSSQLLSDTPSDIISFSPALDTGLAGGVLGGSVMILAGKPKIGKTTTLLHLASKFQQLGRPVFYCDIEHRLKKLNVSGIKGLKPFHVIKSEIGNILSAEQFLEAVAQVCMDEPGALVIVDSFSALSTSGEMAKDMSGNQRSDLGKLMSSFFKHIAAPCSINNVTVAGVCHIINNISGFGASTYISGGSKLFYSASIILKVAKEEKWDSNGAQIGKIITWDVVTSALGAPGAQVQSYLRFGHGLDEVYEIMKIATDIGQITQAGAWYELSFLEHDGKSSKFQGQDATYNFLQENPEALLKLQSNINKTLYNR